MSTPSTEKQDQNVSFIGHGKDAEITYQFQLLDNKPVELGDGTFGCVFHVRGRNRNWALKVFYKTTEPFIQKSQEFEMSIGDSLLSHYIDTPTIGNAVDRYLVVPISRIENFTDSAARAIFSWPVAD